MRLAAFQSYRNINRYAVSSSAWTVLGNARLSMTMTTRGTALPMTFKAPAFMTHRPGHMGRDHSRPLGETGSSRRPKS